MSTKVHHFCLPFLNNGTGEHQEALKNEFDRLGIECCKFRFTKSSFEYSQLKKDYKSIKKISGKFGLNYHLFKNKSKALFLQSPYPEHWPKWFLELAPNLQLAYGGYGLALSNYIEGQFNTKLIQECKFLLAASEYELDGFSKSGSRKSKVIFTGNSLLYEIRRSLLINSTKYKNKPMKLLWAPHWSTEWINGKKGFSRFGLAVKPILDFALTHPDIPVLIRPHPILLESLTSKTDKINISNRESLNTSKNLKDKDIECFIDLLHLKNVEISSSSLMQDVIESTHLITEGVSIIAYWATTGKPILILRDSQSPSFNTNGSRLLQLVAKTGNKNEIQEWLGVINQGSTLKINSDLINLSNSIYPNFEKSPAEIFIESIN
jgi:hypothetical protein